MRDATVIAVRNLILRLHRVQLANTGTRRPMRVVTKKSTRGRQLFTKPTRDATVIAVSTMNLLQRKSTRNLLQRKSTRIGRSLM
jgi:hypothetical protein